MKRKLRMRLGDLLVQEQIINPKELQQALKEQDISGRKLGQTLIALNFLSEEQLGRFLAKQLQAQFVLVSKKFIDSDTVEVLPEVQARRYRALVIDKKLNEVTIALSDPSDLQVQDNLELFFAPRKVNFVVTTETELMQGIENLYRLTEEITSIAGQLEQEYSNSDTFELAQVEIKDEQTTVVKLLNTLFADAVKMRASDIHIEPDEDCLRIRQRIDGQLQEMLIPEISIAKALVLRIKLMANLDISEKRLPQDGHFHIEVNKKNIDVRVSTMPLSFGEAMVMRLLDSSGGLLELKKTGVPDAVLKRIHHHISGAHGMILLTGPTGSGKTTTLYGMLNILNKKSRKIITVEDPIEYQLPRINQVQVNNKIGLDFAKVLRATLRHDPDVIMVGEMRDQETVEIGLRAAITGHLVFSTLHTNDSISTAMRLLDMGAAPYLVASGLRLILAQRLMRKICSHCKKPYTPSPAEQAWIQQVTHDIKETMHLSKGVGCQYCSYSGYHGRIGVFEILELNEAMVSALRQNDTDAFAQAAKSSVTYRPLKLSALSFLAQGQTTIDEAIYLVEGMQWLSDADATGSSSS